MKKMMALIAMTVLASTVGGSKAGTTPATTPAPALEPSTSSTSLALPQEADLSQLPEGLRRSILATLQAADYEITPLPGSAASPPAEGWGFQARNRAHAMRATFTPGGISVGPLDAADATWRLVFTLTGYGHGNVMAGVPAATPVIAGNRVEYRRGLLTEWYLNDPIGLEQGFTIECPPDSTAPGPLRLELKLSGTMKPSLSDGGQAIRLRSSGGRKSLVYDHLAVFDTTGRTLPSHFEVLDPGSSGKPSKIAIVVDDATAVYPVIVDPFVASETRLRADDPGDGDQFGFSVALDNVTALVGAPFADVTGLADAGAAYIFHRDEGGSDNWGQVARLTASDAEAGDQFGFSVALMRAGFDTAVALVGAPGGDAAYVFRRDFGGLDNWGEVQRLTGSNTVAGDGFGYSVALRGGTGGGGLDPDIALIGAPFKDLFDIPGRGSEGAAYFFEREVAGPWHQVADAVASFRSTEVCNADHFGFSVALDENYALIGRPGDRLGDLCDFTFSTGSARLYSRTRDGFWVLERELTPLRLDASSVTNSGHFGWSVAIDGDSAHDRKFYALVGAPHKNICPRETPFCSGGGAGAAYLFARDQGGPDEWGPVQRFTASDHENDARFGWSVAIRKGVSDELNLALVGAPLASSESLPDQGAAYLFVSRPSITNWSELEKITSTDFPTAAFPGDQFGHSVALRRGIGLLVPLPPAPTDQPLLLVGAPFDDHSPDDAGSAYEYGAFVDDQDGDSIPDRDDNCPTVFNPFQEQTGNNVGGPYGDACVDPSVVIGADVTIGENPIIGAGTQIGDGCVIGDFVTIGANVIIGPFCEIGDGTTIGDNTVIGAFTSIGENSVIGSDVLIGDEVAIGEGSEIGDGTTIGDRTELGESTAVGENTFIDSDVFTDENVTIGDGVQIGAGVSIGEGATITDGALVEPGATILPGETVGPPPTKTVFVTSTLQDGNLGGLEGADAICQGLADLAGIGGTRTYKAWLAGGWLDLRSPDTRFTKDPNVPYVRTDGVKVADDYFDLTTACAPLPDICLQAPINVDENGATVDSSTRLTWSNVTTAGLTLSSGFLAACVDWSNNAGHTGRWADSYSVVPSWTQLFPTIGINCGANLHLYCFEQ